MIIHVLLSQLSVSGHPIDSSPRAGEWEVEHLRVIEAPPGLWKGGGRALLLEGKVESPDRIPFARMHLGSGIPDSVLLFVRGKGTYDIRLVVERGGSILSTRKVVEASDEWKPVVLHAGKAIPIVGGLAEKPRAGTWSTLYILPHMEKGRAPESDTFFLYVSPVFTGRR